MPFPSQHDPQAIRRRRAPFFRRGLGGGITFVALIVWGLLGHPRFGGEAETIPQNGCGPVDPKTKGTKIVPKQPKHQKHTGVPVNGPFGAAMLDTAKEVELCVPSTAILP